MKKSVEEWVMYPYPANLVGVVCVCDPHQLNLPEDIVPAVEHVLSNLKSEERQVVMLRFNERLSPSETGERLNLKTQEIRKIEGRAIRALRSPEWRRYLELGYQGGCLATLEEERRNGFNREQVAEILSSSSMISSIHDVADPEARIDIILVRSFFFDISKIGLRISDYPWLLENNITYIWQLCLLRTEDIRKYKCGAEGLAKIEEALAGFRLQLDDGMLANKTEAAEFAACRYEELAGALRFV